MEGSNAIRQMEPLIGAAEAAEYLGFSPLTVRRKAREGKLPSIAFPLGNTGKYLHKFRKSELEAYVNSLERRVLPTPNPEPEIFFERQP